MKGRRDGRNRVMFVRLTEEEHDIVVQAAVRDGELPTIWARTWLLKAAETKLVSNMAMAATGVLLAHQLRRGLNPPAGSGGDQPPVERGARSPSRRAPRSKSATKGRRHSR